MHLWIAFFTVLLAAGGIVTYVVLTPQTNDAIVTIDQSFGYSLYIASAAGGVDLLAALFACAGA